MSKQQSPRGPDRADRRSTPASIFSIFSRSLALIAKFLISSWHGLGFKGLGFKEDVPQSPVPGVDPKPSDLTSTGSAGVSLPNHPMIPKCPKFYGATYTLHNFEQRMTCQ